jgi:hypothetical protein
MPRPYREYRTATMARDFRRDLVTQVAELHNLDGGPLPMVAGQVYDEVSDEGMLAWAYDEWNQWDEYSA